MKEIRRNEIYYAELNPVVGSEQGGLRPVLILQNDTGNKAYCMRQSWRRFNGLRNRIWIPCRH